MDDTIIIEHRGPSSLSGTKAQFTGTVVTFGRRTGNDVVFDPTRDRLVSGRHAELSCRDGRLYLRDLGSSNGTFVNRRRIDGEVQVSAKDRIALGHGGPEMQVRLASDRAAAGPEPRRRSGLDSILRLAGKSSGSGVGMGANTIMMAIERTVGRERKRMAIIGSGAMGLVIVAAFFALRSADDRNTKLERQQRIIANEQSKLASEGGNFEELNTILRESIYMVRVQYLDDGVWKDTGQTGTAWQVDHRLATNAHVAEMFPEASQRNQRMVARVARRGEVVELLITGVKNHPGYDAFARLTAQTSPYQGNLRFLGLLPAWDVALMEVADEDQSKMIRPLPQAAASDVLALESGAGVFFLGFPTEGATNGGTDPRRPVATFRTGSISKVQDYFMGPGKPEDMRLLTFDFSANGGGSGSPIFNRKGEVIALLNSIDVASKGAAGRISGDNSYGMRVDVLIELMDGRAESLLPSRMREWADTLEPQWREGLDRFREEAHAVAASKFKDLASLDFRCRIKDRKVAKIRGTGYQNAATFTWRARELGTGIFMAVAFCRDRPEFMGLRQTILNQGLEDRVESSLGTWWAATWVSAQNPTPLKYEVFAADGAYSGQTEVELVLYEIVPN